MEVIRRLGRIYSVKRILGGVDMLLKEEILAKLEECEQLLEKLEKCFDAEIKKVRKEIILRASEDHSILEAKLKRLEKKFKIKKLSTSINIKNEQSKLQQLG